MNMTITLRIEFLGVLTRLTKRKVVSLEFQSQIVIRDVISELVSRFSPEFKRVLIDPELNDPRSNFLIMLNGKEISALNETIVEDSDELVLLPVSHGG